MNLLQIRTKLVQLSGRYDLVVDRTDYADNGADFLINAGQRYLDRMETVKKSYGRNFRLVTAGVSYAIFQNCRAVKEVWCQHASDGRTKLEKVDMDDLRVAYNDLMTSDDYGTPLYYAPAFLRVSPETDRLTIGDFESYIGYADVMFDQHYEYNGVIFMPPADDEYVIETWGMFYSPELSSDTDESYWSAVNPSVLIMAALREIEVFNRNSEGVKDWENSIRLSILGLGKDFTEENIAEVDQMEG